MIINSITGNGNAMDGIKIAENFSSSNQKKATSIPVKINSEMNAAAENIVQEMEKVKSTVNQLQNISDILGRKLQFNVNEQLGKVVVKVVDPSTDKVIKEIPSAEVQKMQIRIKEAIGLLFDERI